MQLNTRILILFACIFVSACVGLELPAKEATPAPWDPVPSDSEMQRWEIEMVDVEIISPGSNPSQFALQVDGALPTPCHLLRVEVTTSEDQSRIEVEIYSIADPVQICIQVLEPFSEEIPLGDLTSSEYQVFVNDELVGELPP